MKFCPGYVSPVIIVLFALFASACSAGPRSQATPALPTSDPLFSSQGGGEPRSPGYWLVWNSCAPDNWADLAAANGGQEAGWFLLDDLLEDPGILLGELAVDSCQAGVNLLQQRDLDRLDQGVDLAYNLSSQLLAAQLNLAVGAETCTAAEGAVQAAQLLLVSLGFDGRGSYLSQLETSQDHQAAETLLALLAQYNAGELCQ